LAIWNAAPCARATFTATIWECLGNALAKLAKPMGAVGEGPFQFYNFRSYRGGMFSIEKRSSE